MKVLFITYWGAQEGLTAATVLPHLRILSSLESVETIIYASLERQSAEAKPLEENIAKVKHIPLYSDVFPVAVLNKFRDFFVFPRQLAKVCNGEKVDQIICRGSMAGILGYYTHQKTGIPFNVESFEPHASYMRESGVWSSSDLRFLLQSYWERKQKHFSHTLQPVAHQYKKHLQDQENIPAEKLAVIPCCTDLERFGYSSDTRNKIRQNLNLGQDLVGIYVGKFGGIYYDAEAFQIFKEAFELYGTSFQLIILTPDDHQKVGVKCDSAGIPQNKVHILSVPHTDVAQYLSASDFAFSTIKPAPSRAFCSPVKNGEYWASGLPVMMTTGVGDDAGIIEQENAGAIFDLNNAGSIHDSLEKMRSLANEPEIRSRIQSLAEKHRSFRIAREVYTKLYSSQRASDPHSE